MYDPKTSIWHQIYTKNKPESRYEHCAAAMGNYLVISSGKCESGGLFDFWLLDTSQIESLINDKKNNKKDTTLKLQKIEPKMHDSSHSSTSKNGDTTTQNIKAEPRWGQTCIAFHQKLIFFGGWNGKFCFNDVSVVDFKRLVYICLLFTQNRKS